VALALSLSLAACRSAFDWRSHLSLRAGEKLQLSQIDPTEPIEGAVSANLHYVSLSLDAAFLRNLPGVPAGREVALGIEVHGLLPKDEVLRTVVGVEPAQGSDGVVVFENAFTTAPVLYTGRTVRILLYLRAVDRSEAPALRGRLGGAGDVVRRLNPRVGSALQLATDLFHSTVSGAPAASPPWSYEVTLHPAESIHRDKPEMLLTAARHVLLLLPPPGVSHFLRQERLEKLVGRLRLSGNRLVFGDSGQEYVHSPYMVLSVTRFRRFPDPGSPLRRALRRLEELLDQGLFRQALTYVPVVSRELAVAQTLSVVERNLERAWLEARAARAGAELARQDGKPEEELRQTFSQLERLAALRDDFREALEPAERKEMELWASRLVVRAREVGAELGRPKEELKTALQPFVAKVEAVKQREATRAVELSALRREVSRFQTDLLQRQEELSQKLQERAEFVPKLHRQGWFWTVVGIAAAATATSLYFALRPGTPPPTVGATVPPLPSPLLLR
jgi:hypothetical protein